MTGGVDEFSQARTLTVKNTAGEEAPVGGVMQVTSIDATTGAVIVGKPAADSLPLAQLLFVHSAPIPAGGFGTATGDLPWRIKYELADGTPALGEAWGSKAGSWELDKGKTGLIAWGGNAGQTAVFVGAGSGTGTGGVDIRVTGAGTAAGGKTYYPGKIDLWDAVAVDFEDGADVWLLQRANAALTTTGLAVYSARLVEGSKNVGGTTRDLYVTTQRPFLSGVACVDDILTGTLAR